MGRDIESNFCFEIITIYLGPYRYCTVSYQLPAAAIDRGQQNEGPTPWIRMPRTAYNLGWGGGWIGDKR